MVRARQGIMLPRNKFMGQKSCRSNDKLILHWNKIPTFAAQASIEGLLALSRIYVCYTIGWRDISSWDIVTACPIIGSVAVAITAGVISAAGLYDHIVRGIEAGNFLLADHTVITDICYWSGGVNPLILHTAS